jgi:hypothetical protein
LEISNSAIRAIPSNSDALASWDFVSLRIYENHRLAVSLINIET